MNKDLERLKKVLILLNNTTLEKKRYKIEQKINELNSPLFNDEFIFNIIEENAEKEDKLIFTTSVVYNSNELDYNVVYSLILEEILMFGIFNLIQASNNLNIVKK